MPLRRASRRSNESRRSSLRVVVTVDLASSGTESFTDCCRGRVGEDRSGDSGAIPLSVACGEVDIITSDPLTISEAVTDCMIGTI